MTDFILCTTNLVSAKRNLKYPNHQQIASAADLKNAVTHDHVAVEYKDNIRSIDKFLHSSNLPTYWRLSTPTNVRVTPRHSSVFSTSNKCLTSSPLRGARILDP